MRRTSTFRVLRMPTRHPHPRTVRTRSAINILARIGDAVVYGIAFVIDRTIGWVARGLIWVCALEIAGRPMADDAFQCGWCLTITKAGMELSLACCRMSARRWLESRGE